MQWAPEATLDPTTASLLWASVPDTGHVLRELDQWWLPRLWWTRQPVSVQNK